MNLEQAFLNGIYGFIVSASFLGCWVLMMLVAGLLALIWCCAASGNPQPYSGASGSFSHAGRWYTQSHAR